MAIPEVRVDELAEQLAGDAVLFDVRNPDEYEMVRVPGARLVPLPELPDRVGEFPTDRTVYLICRSGARSMRAAEYLAQFGVQGVNVAGGTMAWVESGRETLSGPPVA